MRPLVVYIAGPFRGANAWAIECNVRRAETKALDAAGAGFIPLCPHTNTRFFHGTFSDQFWIDATLELLRRCDAVLLVPGWEASAGTRGEVDAAKRLGIPVFEWLTQLMREEPSIRRRVAE